MSMIDFLNGEPKVSPLMNKKWLDVAKAKLNKSVLYASKRTLKVITEEPLEIPEVSQWIVRLCNMAHYGRFDEISINGEKVWNRTSQQ